MNEYTGDVKIRVMTPNDVQGILDIDRTIIGKDRALSWPQKVTRYLEMYFPPICHVAEVDGKIVGFILGDIRGWEYALPARGWIDIMGVAPAYQRRGIGRRLLRAFAEQCHLRNMKVHIMVREGDETVIKLLNAAGFQRGQLVDFWK